MPTPFAQVHVRSVVATGNVAALRVAGLRNSNRNNNARRAQADD